GTRVIRTIRGSAAAARSTAPSPSPQGRSTSPPPRSRGTASGGRGKSAMDRSCRAAARGGNRWSRCCGPARALWRGRNTGTIALRPKHRPALSRLPAAPPAPEPASEQLLRTLVVQVVRDAQQRLDRVQLTGGQRTQRGPLLDQPAV